MNRTVFKIVAIIVLTGVIVAVSVLKSTISARRQNEKMASIRDEYFKTRDSTLLKMLDDSTRIYVDSIQTLEVYYQAQIDSLNMFYAEKEGLPWIRDTNEGGLSGTADADTIFTLDSTALEVLADYNILLGELPGDLTDYEKRVSIRELTVGLSKKYMISPDSVKKIIKAKS